MIAVAPKFGHERIGLPDVRRPILNAKTGNRVGNFFRAAREKQVHFFDKADNFLVKSVHKSQFTRGLFRSGVAIGLLDGKTHEYQAVNNQIHDRGRVRVFVDGVGETATSPVGRTAISVGAIAAAHTVLFPSAAFAYSGALTPLNIIPRGLITGAIGGTVGGALRGVTFSAASQNRTIFSKDLWFNPSSRYKVNTRTLKTIAKHTVKGATLGTVFGGITGGVINGLAEANPVQLYGLAATGGGALSTIKSVKEGKTLKETVINAGAGALQGATLALAGTTVADNFVNNQDLFGTSSLVNAGKDIAQTTGAIGLFISSNKLKENIENGRELNRDNLIEDVKDVAYQTISWGLPYGIAGEGYDALNRFLPNIAPENIGNFLIDKNIPFLSFLQPDDLISMATGGAAGFSHSDAKVSDFKNLVSRTEDIEEDIETDTDNNDLDSNDTGELDNDTGSPSSSNTPSSSTSSTSSSPDEGKEDDKKEGKFPWAWTIGGGGLIAVIAGIFAINKFTTPPPLQLAGSGNGGLTSAADGSGA